MWFHFILGSVVASCTVLLMVGLLKFESLGFVCFVIFGGSFCFVVFLDPVWLWVAVIVLVCVCL